MGIKRPEREVKQKPVVGEVKNERRYFATPLPLYAFLASIGTSSDKRRQIINSKQCRVACLTVQIAAKLFVVLQLVYVRTPVPCEFFLS